MLMAPEPRQQERPNNAMDPTAPSLAFGSVGAAAHRIDVLATRSCPMKLSPFRKGVEAETTRSTG
jgi:hypothetical protein